MDAEVPEIPVDCIPRELLESPAFLLGRVGVAVKTTAMRRFEEAGFNPYSYSVLALLEEGERATQATIADTLRIDRSQLVEILDGLEEQGMVERRRDPNDRRRHLVSLLPAGRRQLQAFRKLTRKLEAEFLEPLDEVERAELRDLLLRIAAHRDTRYVLPVATPSP